LHEVAQLKQRRLENEQALLQLRRENVLQCKTLCLMHSLSGHIPSLRASSPVGKQRFIVNPLNREVLNG